MVSRGEIRGSCVVRVWAGRFSCDQCKYLLGGTHVCARHTDVHAPTRTLALLCKLHAASVPVSYETTEKNEATAMRGLMVRSSSPGLLLAASEHAGVFLQPSHPRGQINPNTGLIKLKGGGRTSFCTSSPLCKMIFARANWNSCESTINRCFAEECQ